MPTQVTAECPHCLKRFAVRPEQLGKRAKCAACGQRFEVVPIVEVASAPQFDNASANISRHAPSSSENSAAANTPARQWIAAGVAGAFLLLIAMIILHKVISSRPDPQTAGGDPSFNPTPSRAPLSSS